MKNHQWSKPPPIASGCAVYLAVSSYGWISVVYWIIYGTGFILLILLFVGFHPERWHYSLQVRLREISSILILVLSGFIISGLSQIRIPLQTIRTTHGIRMEDVREVKCMLIEDPVLIKKGLWTADAILLEASSENLTAEAKGRVTVFGQSSPLEIGFGRIIQSTGYTEKPLFWYSDEITPNEWRSRLLKWRHSLLGKMSEGLERTSHDTFTFLSALILGRRIDSGSRIIRQFREAGCMHLLALSGFHVGLIAVAIRRITMVILGMKGSSMASLLVVVVYLLMAGFRPSLVRAVLMYTMWTRDRYRGYQTSPLNYLCTAFIFQIILFPRSVNSLSFLLSYTALVGILTGGLSLSSILKRYIPVHTAGIIGISIGAQTAAMPIITKAFGIWRPIAIVSAAFLTPPVALSMAAGTVLMLIPVGRITEFNIIFLDTMVELMTVMASFFSRVPALRVSPFLSWPIMAVGTILPTLYKNNVHTVEPQLPSLNPQISQSP